MPKKTEFVRFNTIKNYIKEKEQMRSAVETVNSLTSRFNSLIETVIESAVSLAKARNRTTILAEDMKAAIEKTVGKKHLNWEELLLEILSQTPIDLGNLSKGITKYIEEHEKEVSTLLSKLETIEDRTSPKAKTIRRKLRTRGYFLSKQKKNKKSKEKEKVRGEL